MKELYGKYSRTIKRVIGTQIVTAIFSVVIFMAVYSNDLLIILASVLAIMFYLFIIYSFMWESGAKIGIMTIKPPLSERIKTAGFIMLSSNALNIILIIFYTVSYVSTVITNGINAAPDNFGSIVWLILRVILAMFMGVETMLYPNPEQVVLLTNPVFYFIIILPAIIAGMTAFILGTMDISILRKLGFDYKPLERTDIKYK